MFPLIGLVVSPLLLLYGFWVDILPCFQGELWSVLTTPGGALYSSYWPVYLIGAAVGAVGLAVWDVVVLVLFLQRRRLVPVFISVLYLMNVALVLFDWASLRYLVTHVAALDGVATQANLQAMFRAAISAAVWVPYFWRSVRVRNTFVR